MLGIVLLGVRFGYSDDSDKDYFVVKKYVAFASFLEVLVFIAILALKIVGTNFLMVNHFLAPLVLFSNCSCVRQPCFISCAFRA